MVVLDPDVNAPAKQVASPSLLPLPEPSLQHIDGAFTSLSMIMQLAQQVDVLTIEIEHVDVDALEHAAEHFKTSGGRSGNGVKVYPAPSIIRTIQDKYLQKVHLQARGIPVAPFLQITAQSTNAVGGDLRSTLNDSVLSAVEQFGLPLMLKSRHLAYDGKGNYVLRGSSKEEIAEALAALIPDASLQDQDANARPIGERLYAEKWAPFTKEVAVMVARGADGTTRSYPAVETIHRDSVCHIVYAPLRPVEDAHTGIGRDQSGKNFTIGEEPVERRAQAAAAKAIDALGEGAVGVFGVEMFLLPDGEYTWGSITASLRPLGSCCSIAGSLLLNEIAPRPHNSGHYTIEACNISQYTAHLYAILSIPLPPISFIPASAGMLNLLGWSSDAAEDFLANPDGVVHKAIQLGAAVHLYGKKGCRKGRKMGHVTILGESDEEVRTKIETLVACLPGDYAKQDLPEAKHDARSPLVSIIMGSDSDLPVMLPATRILDQFNVPYETSIVSAHRTPARMIAFARTAAGRGVRVIIAGAGGAAHLPGMVASETSLPVLGVPVKASVLDGVDSLYSIVQMPRGIPVAALAINNSMNAGLLAVRILATHVPRLRRAIELYGENLEAEVLDKVEHLAQIGSEAYVSDRLGKKV